MISEEQIDNLRLVRSALALVGPSGSIEDILHWLKSRNKAVRVDIDQIDFSAMKGWHFDKDSGDLEHDSGKFFSIRGLNVDTDGYNIKQHWQQPIIDQPEVGFLGIIMQEIDGILCFLLQGKIEPGNLNHVQLSPTLQATRSNYMQIHKGKAPHYLEYFRNAKQHKIWLDQLQSEQGGRFFHKRNRNIIIEVKEPVSQGEDFLWVTLGQLKALMCYDNTVNMDTRTIISGLGWRGNDFAPIIQYLHSDQSRAMLASLYRLSDEDYRSFFFWLSELKTKYLLRSRLIPLKSVQEWQIKSNEIVHRDQLYFRVIGANVTISNREVAQWCQPLVQPKQEGICALLMKPIGGVMHFLVQAKIESGNLDIVELAPTVQCLTGAFHESSVPFLKYVLSAKPEQVVYDCMQSEEGGRFYHEQNRNMLILADDSFCDDDSLPENFYWMRLWQLREMLLYNNYLNIQLRSLLAAINIFVE